MTRDDIAGICIGSFLLWFVGANLAYHATEDLVPDKPDPDSYVSNFLHNNPYAIRTMWIVFWIIPLVFVLLSMILYPFVLLYKFIYGYFERRKERIEKEKKRAAIKEDEMIEMLKRKTAEAEKLIEQNK